MAKQLFLNNFESTFIANVKDTASSGTPATELDYGILRLNSGAAAALVNPTGGDYYILTAYKKAGSLESNVEVMKVTAVDNSTINECRITVSRAQEGTTAQAYVPGDFIALRFTKGGAANMVQAAELTDAVNTLDGAKQDVLVSGTNIKTVNGTSLLGSGNVAVTDASKLPLTGGSLDGDLTFTNAGRRLRGLLSSTTALVDRLFFQSSTTDGSTDITAVPNGTSTSAGYIAINASDTTNNAFLAALALGTDIRFWSGKNGTGTALPMTFYVDNTERMRIATDGKITVESTINASPAHRNAAVNLSGTTLDFTAGTDFYKTIAANTTIALSNVSAASGLAQAVQLTINHTGGTVAFSGATLKWAGGAAPTFTSGRVHQVYFWPDPITNQVLASAVSYY